MNANKENLQYKSQLLFVKNCLKSLTFEKPQFLEDRWRLIINHMFENLKEDFKLPLI